VEAKKLDQIAMTFVGFSEKQSGVAIVKNFVKNWIFLNIWEMSAY